MEAHTYLKDKDVSYINNDGTLQLENTRAIAIRRLQEWMEVRLHQGEQPSLPYYLDKTGLIHLWPLYSNQWPPDATSQPAITNNNTEIKPSASIKHLRVHIDDTLAFYAHTDEETSQGYKCLGQLSALHHNYRGLPTHMALHLVKAALLPKILWAFSVWWTGSQHILDRLEPVYHQALR